MAIIVALCTLACTSCQRFVRAQQMSALSDSVETITINYELPQILDNRSQQIIEHLAYTVCYNHDWLIPNWVAIIALPSGVITASYLEELREEKKKKGEHDNV